MQQLLWLPRSANEIHGATTLLLHTAATSLAEVRTKLQASLDAQRDAMKTHFSGRLSGIEDLLQKLRRWQHDRCGASPCEAPPLLCGGLPGSRGSAVRCN